MICCYISYVFYSFYDLGPPLPNLEVDDLLNEEKNQELIFAIDQRIKKKEELREAFISLSMILNFDIRDVLQFL